MLSTSLEKLIAGVDLTQDESAGLLESILAEETTDSQISAVLIALAAKGETAEELAGFAQTMRSKCARLNSGHKHSVDTCGTGGSPAKTFNVSTAAAFVVAGSGVPVAKHGNVGVTSKSGSADVLRALGVRIDINPDRVGEIFDETGICFMFAPLHHAATKRVAMVRRELGVRTIFNLIGPLTNPAGAPYQVLGVSNEAACEKLAMASAHLGTNRSWIVRGEDGLDEITLAGKTVVYEASADSKDGRVRRFEIGPADFGLSESSMGNLRGGSPEDNASIIRSVLDGTRRDQARDLVLINAAAAIYICGKADSITEAADVAGKKIDDGSALNKLKALTHMSNS